MTVQIISALPVSFSADGTIEWDTFDALLTRVAPHVHAALIAGTTGEFPSLDDDERQEAFRRACLILGTERVIAHIGHASLHQVVRIGRAAAQLGITRMATLSPYYLPADDAAVIDFYRGVTSALPGIEHYVYLFPERTGIVVSPETFGEIMALPGVRGAKLSGAATELLVPYIAQLQPGQELYSGDDSTLPLVLAEGGTGVVSGVSAAYPETFARLAAALDEAVDGTEAARLQQTVVALVQLTGPSIIRLKAAVSANVPGTWESRMSMAAIDDSLRQDLLAAASSNA
ncbi:dihydrodipicolinate synthase family protein [Cryobacterium sp. N19]|uniref:dihydrodipicolinate synthase family protein n=1 Tax=Cryobacterium sp. N19 TaxID=2048288 RepID=UPI000CE4BE53|nr:dihydrodipicolinate synthase family protein [Cryobacterium sp. N19]